MASEVAIARSNDFKVKDEAAFLQWAESLQLDVWQTNRDGERYFAIYTDPEKLEEGWPLGSHDEETDEWLDIDIAEELSHHLQEGSVAVLMESGHMGYQCISGSAIAVNSRGEEKRFYLIDIFNQIDHLGTDIESI